MLLTTHSFLVTAPYLNDTTFLPVVSTAVVITRLSPDAAAAAHGANHASSALALASALAMAPALASASATEADEAS